MLTCLDVEALAAQAVKEGAQDYLLNGQIENRALPRALRHAIERHRMLAESDLIRTVTQPKWNIAALLSPRDADLRQNGRGHWLTEPILLRASKNSNREESASSRTALWAVLIKYSSVNVERNSSPNVATRIAATADKAGETRK